MRPHSLLHRTLTVAFAIWVSLCCCEKRILAQSLCDADDAARPSLPSCCAGGCCVSDDGGASHEGERRPSSCADGCCRKSAATLPCWSVDVDAIGTPLHSCIGPGISAADAAGRVLAHDDRTAGEPPPKLALVISRRLRI
jgi:hypothetical protein